MISALQRGKLRHEGATWLFAVGVQPCLVALVCGQWCKDREESPPAQRVERKLPILGESGHDTHRSSWPARIPLLSRKVTSSPLPILSTMTCTATGNKGWLGPPDTRDRGLTPWPTSWQGDTLALGQPDTPEQEPKRGVRSFHPFLQSSFAFPAGSQPIPAWRKQPTNHGAPWVAQRQSGACGFGTGRKEEHHQPGLMRNEPCLG